MVPSFLDSYKLGQLRGRSERVKIIYEELLCLPRAPSRIAFVGHSQGGAASSLAITDRIVEAKNVVGLLLIGSESVLDGRDGHAHKPRPKNVLRILHAEDDQVVPFSSVARLGENWCVPVLTALTSVKRGTTMRGDDVAHDFLAHDLLETAQNSFRFFLRDCLRDVRENYVVSVSPSCKAFFEETYLKLHCLITEGKLHFHLGLDEAIFGISFFAKNLKKVFLNNGKFEIEVDLEGGNQFCHRLDSTKEIIEANNLLFIKIQKEEQTIVFQFPKLLLDNTCEMLILWKCEA